MKPDVQKLVRNNIKELKPYSSARNEYSGSDAIFLDANENPYNQPYNRYPDPMHTKIREKLAALKKVKKGQIFLGNGSDEGIDLLIRAFCEPKLDIILSMEPTYGMYKVSANINDVPYFGIRLTDEFQLDVPAFLKKMNNHTKLIFLCSPNNPTGNTLNRKDILRLLDAFHGLVVVDEAYIDFSNKESLLKELDTYKNLAVLQTFSKAWGLAGIRFGMVYADEAIIDVLYKIKYPYNLNSVTQKLAVEYLDKQQDKEDWVRNILKEKSRLEAEIQKLPMVLKNYPTDANFLMVKVARPWEILNYLKERKIIVRDRSNVTMCEGCLRITIGNRKENDTLMKALKNWKA